jgi:hypothetical protein
VPMTYDEPPIYQQLEWARRLRHEYGHWAGSREFAAWAAQYRNYYLHRRLDTEREQLFEAMLRGVNHYGNR